jgi:hypothetical protein
VFTASRPSTIAAPGQVEYARQRNAACSSVDNACGPFSVTCGCTPARSTHPVSSRRAGHPQGNPRRGGCRRDRQLVAPEGYCGRHNMVFVGTSVPYRRGVAHPIHNETRPRSEIGMLRASAVYVLGRGDIATGKQSEYRMRRFHDTSIPPKFSALERFARSLSALQTGPHGRCWLLGRMQVASALTVNGTNMSEFYSTWSIQEAAYSVLGTLGPISGNAHRPRRTACR